MATVTDILYYIKQKQQLGKTFAQYLHDNNNIVHCPICRLDIYEYVGDYQGIIKAKDFIPLLPDIPMPQPGEEIRCPICKIALVSEIKEI